jgi:hypothetical protein
LVRVLGFKRRIEKEKRTAREMMGAALRAWQGLKDKIYWIADFVAYVKNFYKANTYPPHPSFLFLL